MDMISEATRVAKHEAALAARLAHAGEYLTFRLGAEEYGIDILKVQEIRSYEAPTRIANAPAFVKGVVNLRGVIVPIVDLRLKLACESAEYNAFTVVIVLNVRGRVVRRGGRLGVRCARAEPRPHQGGARGAHRGGHQLHHRHRHDRRPHADPGRRSSR